MRYTAASVGTRYVSRDLNSSIASSSSRWPCSIEVTPARSAFLIPLVPIACAAIDEARTHGMRVAAHAIGTNGIKNALRAGVTSIEHGHLLDDEAIELFKSRETYLVPTLAAVYRIYENIAGGARARRHALRDRELAQPRQARGGGSGRAERGSRAERRGVERAARCCLLRARERVRPDPQQLRLEAAAVRSDDGGAAADHHGARLLVAADSGRVLRRFRALVLLLDQRRRPRPRPRLPGDDLQRNRSERVDVPLGTRRLSPLLRTLPSGEGPASGDRAREACGRAAEARRDPAGRRVLRRADRAARRRRSPVS